MVVFRSKAIMNSNLIKDVRLPELNPIADFQTSKQIVSLIAHEMRNPLAIISSNLQLLKSGHYQLEDSIVEDAFALCTEAIQSMTEFIHEICFLNTAFKGELKACFGTVELDVLLEKVLAICASSDFNRSRVQIEKQNGLNTVYTDGNILRRLLVQLVRNALNFSSEKVRIELSEAHTELVIRISDRGIGIPENEKHLIFEPFARCSNIKMISGSGIGLTIVKACVELLGGIIDFESVQNHGTTFTIKISIHESEKGIDYRR